MHIDLVINLHYGGYMAIRGQMRAQYDWIFSSHCFVQFEVLSFEIIFDWQLTRFNNCLRLISLVNRTTAKPPFLLAQEQNLYALSSQTCFSVP